MLILSVCIHAAALILLTLFPWFSSRKIHVPIYPVTLITQAAPRPRVTKAEATVRKKPVRKPPKKVKEKPVTVKKPKPKPKPKKKVPPKKKVAKKDVISEKRVQKKIESRIERLRKKLEAEEKPEVKEEVAQVASKPSRAVIDMRLRTYYNSIWQRIKEEWILPESLLEEVRTVPIIVIKIRRDGTILESWFEEKSGSSIYDGYAMRAIKKANPLPPFPQELEEEVLEIGIRFHPE
jgi:outer membrane biosynthesis protein TonB